MRLGIADGIRGRAGDPGLLSGGGVHGLRVGLRGGSRPGAAVARVAAAATGAALAAHAARRELLERLPFVTGYGVDIALLIDAYREAGLEAIAQVDLDVRQNAHQSLRDLGPMAFSVLRALASRLEREGRLQGPLPSSFLIPGEAELGPAPADAVERPPLASLRAAA